MRGFLALNWAIGDIAAARNAQSVRQQAEAEGWIAIEAGETSWVGVRGPNPPKAYSPRSGTLIIGDVFNRPDAESGSADGDTDLTFARWYSLNRWGRYVMLFRGPSGRLRRVFRDPSGALSAHGWSAGGVQVLCSSTPDWLLALARPDVDFDWDRISALVISPHDMGGRSLLTGIVSAGAGCLQDLDGSSICVWSPGSIAGRPDWNKRIAGEELRQTLDAVVAALAGTRPVSMELSGGLDSAIIAGAVRALGRPVCFALNTRAQRPETDERQFARDVAGAVGAKLTCSLREEIAYSAEAFEATAGEPWPSQNGRDLSNDFTVIGACRSAGVETLMTGKGGDALFFQTHTPLAFADLWWRRPVRSAFSPHLPGVARWTRTSTWSLIRAAHASRRLPSDDLPPGKRLQIAAITSGLAYHSYCRRSDVVDMIHPLMAQPLVEWALRTPVPLLVPDGAERGLARSVFVDRLPASVATRRGKGDYSAYFNQQAARNLPFLKSYLLDGRLASRGVIERALVEDHLNEDVLRWQGGAAELLALVSLEAWVRRWEARRAGV